ncbi:MAG TPA: ParB/RepB/Spo0J family partition protein [Candidatus Binatia bacterium]|nr:ParB/RepB/Spo0J family partition protein [Candidatus Binatia bacterium]
MTTNTAANVAGHGEKDKEKVEKRRALGRGLASLLPGPRVLNPFAKKEDSAEGTGVKAAGSHGPDGRSATVTAGEAEGQSAHASLGMATKTGSTDLSPNVVENAHPVAQNATRMGHPQEIPSGSAIASGVVDYAPFEEAPAGGVIEIQAVADTRVPSNLVVNLAISDIDKNPFQTRYVDDDDALEELADSIKANGVVQPIVVRPAQEDGRYTLILGERRLHASKKAGKTQIPALVRRVSEQQAAEMTIIENLQREDLSPLEQAEAFRVLSNKFSMTQQQIAERVGLSRTSIANYMRLLKLPREVMQMLAEKRLNFAQAKELLKLGENDRIAEAALYAVKKGMNIEQIEMLVLRMDGLLDPLPDMPGVQKEKKSSGARWVDPNVRSAQMDLERMLGVRVRIRDRKGRGKIVIEYSTVDDYERVVEMLRGKK